MATAPWILKTFQIDQTGQTGAHLYIEARQPGLIAFILNIIGLDPTAQLKVTRGAVSFRSTSLSGMTETSTALTQIGSFQGGYSKPIKLLFGALFFMVVGLIVGISFEEMTFFTIGLVVAAICVIAYALQKNLSFGFETSGGAYYGMAFKRGVLNNVSVDIKQVEIALQLVNTLIGAASLGDSYQLTDNVQRVAPQTTIQVQQPAQATPATTVQQMPQVAPATAVSQTQQATPVTAAVVQQTVAQSAPPQVDATQSADTVPTQHIQQQ